MLFRSVTAGTRPEPGRVRVEPEHDLGLALGDPRGERVSEGGGGRVQRPLTAFFSALPALKRGTRDAAI